MGRSDRTSKQGYTSIPPPTHHLREEVAVEEDSLINPFSPHGLVGGQPRRILFYLVPTSLPRWQRRWRPYRICLLSSFLLFLCAVGGAGFFLWPHTPHVHLAQLHLESIDVHVDRSKAFFIPTILVDINLNLRVRVRNENYFSIKNMFITACISYSDDEIGKVKSIDETVLARSTTYVDADLALSGHNISSNIFSLISDLAKKELPLSTTVYFNGEIKILFYKLPLETTVSCDMMIDTETKTIKSKDCDLEAAMLRVVVANIQA